MRNPFRNSDEGSSYPKSPNDRQLLVENRSDDVISFGPNSPCAIIKRNKNCSACILSIAVVALCLAIGIYYHRIRCTPSNCVPIKVMSLNTWGMPENFGSQYKTERMKAIAEEVAKANYDLYLFQELWMQPDYWTIRSVVPEGYYMTEFRDLALSTCDGRATPAFCSGLAVISKFPFNETEFDSYTYHGNALNSAKDGEWLARKGVGRVRVYPTSDVSVDVFVTHTAADPDARYNYTNEWYRKKQVEELVGTFINRSTADIVLLGGDFNAGPDMSEGSPYEMLRRLMTNCVEEIFYKVNEWMDAKFATYGNGENTFSGHLYDPIIYDYIFFKMNTDKARVYTNWFELPLFKTKLLIDSLIDSIKNENETVVVADVDTAADDSTSTESSPRSKREVHSTKEKLISFSDHEAVTSTIYIRF
jgi:endonuclease/exonuclease/phosphatase family metal-dependent hydrolase